MELVKIKKVRKKFKGYNTPHQCHKNAYYYCYDNDDCKFVVEEYFDVDEIMENKYLKDKVNQKLILIIGGYDSIDISDYENDDNELDVKKAFKEWKKGIIKYYGLTLSDEDWKECFIHYANKTYGDIDEDEL